MKPKGESSGDLNPSKEVKTENKKCTKSQKAKKLANSNRYWKRKHAKLEKNNSFDSRRRLEASNQSHNEIRRVQIPKYENFVKNMKSRVDHNLECECPYHSEYCALKNGSFTLMSKPIMEVIHVEMNLSGRQSQKKYKQKLATDPIISPLAKEEVAYVTAKPYAVRSVRKIEEKSSR